jgi:hypothetical protein
MDADPSSRLRVHFVTKLLPPLRMSTTSFTVPADLSHGMLSDIVNRILAVGERHG